MEYEESKKTVFKTESLLLTCHQSSICLDNLEFFKAENILNINNTNSSTKTGKLLNKKPLNRRTKKKQFKPENSCELCHKQYLSYAALYTHKRNKHNIIPITARPKIFKASFHKQKFHYTDRKSVV